MTTSKKSFVIYNDVLSTVKKLPDEHAGKLFKIILEFANGNEIQIDDLLLQIAFEPIKQTIIRDREKYEIIRNRNISNGLKGGRPVTQNNPTKPSGLITIPNIPKKADSVNDSGSLIEIDTNNVSVYSFEYFWNDYEKKGNKKQSQILYKKISEDNRIKIKEHLQKYVAATPDKKYRKDAERYLRHECWNDEIIQNSQSLFKKETNLNGRMLTIGITPKEPGSYIEGV